MTGIPDVVNQDVFGGKEKVKPKRVLICPYCTQHALEEGKLQWYRRERTNKRHWKCRHCGVRALFWWVADE